MPSLKERQDQDSKYNPGEQRFGGGEHDDLGVHPERREAEAEDLDNLFNAESRADEDRNTGGGASSQAEQEALSDDSSDADESDSPWSNKVSGKKGRFSITGKQAAAGGGAAGILIGGSIGFFTFMAGPLQFLQFSQLLQRFHFSSSENFSNHRMSKIYRFIAKKPPNRQDFNLSRTGNKLAIHYEKKMGAKGVDIEYGHSSGRMSKMTLNPDTPVGKKIIASIEAENGVSMPKDADGKVRLEFAERSGEITSAKVRRKMINGAVDAMEMNGVSSAMYKRMLKKRAGVSFHPLKNAARSLDEKLRLSLEERSKEKQKIKDERNKAIKEGSSSPDIETGKRVDDPDGSSSEVDKVKSAELDGEAAEIKKVATEPGIPHNERVSKVKGRIGKGMGVVAVAGLICGVRALGEASATLQEQNIVQPLTRLATTGVITPAAQIMSGQGVDMDTLGVLSESFYDKETGTSWMSAESIQYNLGNPNTGVKIPESAKPGKDKPLFFKTVDNIVNGIPGFNPLCNALNSTFGGLAASLAGIALSATGPFAIALNVGGEVAQQAIAHTFMDDLVRWLAGEAVDVANAKGGEFGALADTGAFLADNNTSAGIGGRTLTPVETAALINENNQILKKENQQKSFYARILDLKSPDSLISKATIQNNTLSNPVSSFASLLKSPFSFIGSIGSKLAVINPRVHAQTTPYDYGVDKIGFSISERDNSEVENPYDNEAIVVPQLAELNEKYGKPCFGTTIDPSSGKIEHSQAPTYQFLEANKSTCGSENTDINFLRYRMYLADTTTMATVACYESIDESACSDLGFGGSDQGTNQAPSEGSGNIAATPYESSADVPCASGTNDLGVADAYVSGQLVQHRFCAVTNLPSSSSESTPGSAYYMSGANGHAIVNSRLSGSVYNMINDAKTAGISLSASSSFRTMAHQQALFNSSDKTGKSVARPGGSSHQSGTAIDFANMGVKGGSSSDCSNRKRADGNKGWEWLFANAEKYGLKQYSYEPWHWDPGPPGLNNRCTSAQP